jgi:hypothetical protein
MKTGSLMALVLFGLFAVCILFLLLTGADVYQRLTVRDRNTYEMRTAAQYLTTKMRQADTDGCLLVSEFEGLDALLIREEIEGSVYHTWIYCYDGYVRELFFEDGLLFQPGDGQTIVPARELSVEASAENLIQLECVGETGNQETMTIYLRSGKGADCYA